MTAEALAAVALFLAAIPTVIFLFNLKDFQPAPEPRHGETVSVLIPARDEAGSIGEAVESVLACDDPNFELIVLDDHSTDGTAEIVRTLAARDPRVRLESAPPLPEGWCGKQHACFALAQLARHDWLIFLDADVRLSPDALGRLVAFMNQSNADLGSGFPREITGSFLEVLLIPLIHFVLLGFLPLEQMRKRQTTVGMGTGCGQLFIARRKAYEAVGGHGAVRTSLHDGVTLPRAFRAAGFRTDLFDATDMASCRMYRNARDTWFGLAKNATEGLATKQLIGPATVLLAGGQVLPFLLCATGHGSWLAFMAAAVAWLPRWIGVPRFRQHVLGAVFHPVGVALLLAIQWYALVRKWTGKPATWKGRTYAAEAKTG